MTRGVNPGDPLQCDSRSHVQGRAAWSLLTFQDVSSAHTDPTTDGALFLGRNAVLLVLSDGVIGGYGSHLPMRIHGIVPSALRRETQNVARVVVAGRAVRCHDHLGLVTQFSP